MSSPSITSVLEAEFKNYEISKSHFEDILTWGERIREIASTDNLYCIPNPPEYFDLIQISGNAFVTSLLLIMKAHVFFGFAVARVGLESVINQWC